MSMSCVKAPVHFIGDGVNFSDGDFFSFGRKINFDASYYLLTEAALIARS